MFDDCLEIVLEEVEDGEEDAGAEERRQDGRKSQQVAVIPMRPVAQIEMISGCRRGGAVKLQRRRRRQEIGVQSLGEKRY